MLRVGLRGGVLLLCVAASLSLLSAAQAASADAVRSIVEQALSARAAGKSLQEREILERGLEAVGPEDPASYTLYQMLGQHHADLGNLARAAELSERALKLARAPLQEHAVLARLVSLRASLRQKVMADSELERLGRLERKLRSSAKWQQVAMLVEARSAWARAYLHASRGHLAQAEQEWTRCLSSARAVLQDTTDDDGGLFYLIDCTAGLMNVHIATGQLAAAGAVADEEPAAITRFAERAQRPAINARIAGAFGRLALEQGRTDDARRILLQALESMQAAGAGDTSLRAAGLRAQLAEVEMLLGRWDQALVWHRVREEALRRAGEARGNRGILSVDYAYTLLRLGRKDEALNLLDRIVAAQRKLFDESSLFLWESRAFRGLALADNGRRDEALAELKIAMPRLLDIMKGDRSSNEAGVSRSARLNWLLEGYIAVLSDALRGAAPGTWSVAAAEDMDEAFRMADLARGSSVQRALAAATSRLHPGDPALADLARSEQDLQREIGALSQSLDTLLAAGPIPEQEASIADMRADLARLRAEHALALAALEERFPDYAALLDPSPVGMAAIQALLRPGEALISVHVGADRSIVWALPAQGAPAFAVVPLAAGQLARSVQALRASLDPDVEAAGGPPDFPFDVGHQLYAGLLAPVERAWKGARELIVVPHGALDQLPLAVLTTAPFHAARAAGNGDWMAMAPWLIKEVAISRLPAVMALQGLRSRRHGPAAARAFIGFGDPVFSAAAGREGLPAGAGSQRRHLLATPPSHSLRPGETPAFAPAIDFRLLPQLPDTGAEIEEIAGVLAADPTRDVFLGQRASEGTVKRTDLTRYRVVMFATHGLMRGQMPGLFQPALALSNPALAGDGEDGMLTMEEVLGLRLDADWVVLLACNTAAAGRQSGESISGLGRAFFYAGARALLVTHWAVETESARMLTTEMFRLLAAEPGLSGARALQRSSLALMRRPSGKDYSYAYPMFWAPYSLVGDGG
jgi:CHAT domain-containing protein/tetratricopeptide (TPR) repeat protein